MGRIIRLHGDDHREVQTLLPWYVTGRLEAPDHARVEAHLVHCADCKAEVRFQRRLGAQIAGLPSEVEQGWQEMLRRIQREPPPRALMSPRAWLGRRGESLARFVQGTPWTGWAVAGALVIALGAISLVPAVRTGPYHALGAAAPSDPGNVLVMFRPDTAEKTMRELLTAGKARVTDGPTAAGAYVLRVPASERKALLEAWRRQGDILLAEPIDSGARR
jgi:anti-sigma factor RsiW